MEGKEKFVTQDLFRHLRIHTRKKEMSEMRQLDARQQLLVILMEECGELIQECSKSLRKGELCDRQTFKDEVGDVYTMINLLHEWAVVSWSDIEEREQHKRSKLSRWSDLITDHPLQYSKLTNDNESRNSTNNYNWKHGDGGELFE